MSTICAAAIVLAALAGTDAGSPRPVTYESLLREMVDRSAVARWPDPAYECGQASSYDRASTSPEKKDTWFANADANQFVRIEDKPGGKEWVLLDVAGPGAVVRFWSANPRDDITVRFYLDGSEQPALAAPLSDLLGGTWRVGAPLSAIRGKGWNLYLPIPYAKSCKITTDRDNFYYQINYRTYAAGTAVESFSMPAFEQGRAVLREVTEQLLLAGRNLQPIPVQTQRLDGRLAAGDVVRIPLAAGPRCVTALSVRLHADDMAAAYRNTVLRMTFDGAETVWCPVGDFFGSGVGVNPFRSWWQVVEADGTMTCTWPMPYAQAAELDLENNSAGPVQFALTVRQGDWSWDERSMLFHATWRHEHPISTAEKRDWNFVEVQGQGVYVGDTLALYNPTTVWWGEGDEKIFVDGEPFPSHFGTGTEDYYGYAWGDWHFFEGPFQAQPRVDGPVVYGHTSLLRTRALDAIPFEKSLRFDMEIWHWRAVEVAYAATTRYYARPGAADNRAADRRAESLGVVETAAAFVVPGAVEAEQMEVVSRPADAEWKIEGNWWNARWSCDAQIWFGCPRVGDAVELRCPQMLSGRQELTLYATRYPDYGIIRVSVDGRPVGEPVDLCNTESDGVVATGAIPLGTFEPGAAPPVVRIEVVGRNPKAQKTGTYFGIDCFVFTPAGP